MNLNFKTPPFDNPKLRQAIAYAMPYQQIATVGYAGSAQRMEGHFSRSLNGYAKPSTQYATDIAKAKQLLAEAGYPDGKGLEKFPDCFKLAFVAERESFLGPIATVIQSALKDVGIPVQLDPLPQTQMSDRRIVKKDLPMALSDQEKPVGPDVGYATKLFFVTRPQRRREQSRETTRARRSIACSPKRRSRWTIPRRLAICSSKFRRRCRTISPGSRSSRRRPSGHSPTSSRALPGIRKTRSTSSIFRSS